MVVTINGGGKGSRKAPPSNKLRSVTNLEPAKFEVYGRLQLNSTTIAELEGLTKAQVVQVFRKPEFRQSYERGKAQGVIAIRQKILTQALAGDTRLLLHAAERLAGLGEADRDDLAHAREAEQHSWDGEFTNTMNGLRAKYLPASDDAESA